MYTFGRKRAILNVYRHARGAAADPLILRRQAGLCASGADRTLFFFRLLRAAAGVPVIKDT